MTAVLPAESYWLIWRDNVTDGGDLYRLFFRGEGEITRLRPGTSLKEILPRFTHEFRLMNADYHAVVQGYAEQQSNGPLLWGRHHLGNVTLEYRLKPGEEAWFEVK